MIGPGKGPSSPAGRNCQNSSYRWCGKRRLFCLSACSVYPGLPSWTAIPLAGVAQGCADAPQKLDAGEIHDASSSAPALTNKNPGAVATRLKRGDPQSLQKPRSTLPPLSPVTP